MATSLVTRTRRRAGVLPAAALALLLVGAPAYAQPPQIMPVTPDQAIAVPAGNGFMTIGDGAHATGLEPGEAEPGDGPVEAEHEPGEATHHVAMPATADPAMQTRQWVDAMIQRASQRGDAAGYALQKRADLVESVDVAKAEPGVRGGFAGPMPDLMVTSAPQAWPREALIAGYGISNTPTNGALMVRQPGVMGADAQTGDVAYVESVATDGTFTVSEQQNDTVSTRTIAIVDLPATGVDFIS